MIVTAINVPILSLITAFTGKFITIKNVLVLHRLILAALVVSTKYNEDIIYKNSHYAKVGGVSLEELNLLEHYFLENIDYNIYINPEEYKLCSKYLYDSVKLLMKDEEIVSPSKKSLQKLGR